MQRKDLMAAGGVSLAGLGALVGLAIGSANGGQKPLAQRIPPVEVRTEIVRRTINVYRREHPHHAGGRGPGLAGSTSRAPGSTSPASATSRTRSSGARGIVPAAPKTPVVTTRSSGLRATGGPAPTPRTIKTRSSGASSSGSGSGSTRSVRTRTSGGDGSEGDGGGHGD